METKELKEFLSIKHDCTKFHSDLHEDTGINLSEHDAAALTKKYREEHNLSNSPAYFIGIKKIDMLWGVPGIQGIRIYPGMTENGREVLILVAATEAMEKSYDILEYSYTIFNNPEPILIKREHSGLKDDAEQEQGNVKIVHQKAPLLVAKPCPPPNPCPPKNNLNSNKA